MEEQQRKMIDLVQPVSKLIIDTLIKQKETTSELRAYMKTIPLTEFTEDNFVTFAKKLTDNILANLPEGLNELRPYLPDMIESNFLKGMKQGVEKRRDKENNAVN